ncbi:putative ATPase [Mumia flava]|uniref:Putative ATPase n=1 Tax=Mumia flava TaxID=1348852 RepID=A0A2M9BKF1_9ACTN|nr:BTAD domain-containing putative transcriptional regulator [Mumia flava]PJJ58429.1 putative ATPase [Mumia flava]
MQVRLLGPFEITDGDGRSIDVGGPRNRALVARLALALPHAVAIETLIDDLWGTEIPQHAHNALQSVVSRTRARLGDGAITVTAGGYRLTCESTDVDVHRFTRLAGQGRSRDALALWRGDALDGIGDAPYVATSAAGLDERRLAVLEDRVESDLGSGDYEVGGLVTELRALVAAHPYRERLAVSLVRALAASGRQADALAAYEQMRSRLADDLGLDPSLAAQQVQAAVLRGDADVAAPRRAALAGEGVRTNLRPALTSFVGRDDLVEHVRALCSARRLVTVVGPGGAGKTRLATEAASGAVPDPADGAWLVELASVTDPDQLLDAIVAALGLRDVAAIERGSDQRPTARRRVVETLAAGRPLLVVDNCEHLVADVAVLVEDLLRDLPGLTVLATSREPLAVPAETVVSLGPLAVAPGGATPDEALGYGAVDLFVQRARAAAPSFVLDAAALPAVLEICRRLDGQPLALELAAARLRTLTPQQVAARLGDRFRLLTGGSRTALPRHRTLRAVVEWSWDLLSDAERDLAERVAVLPGGVTASAAAALAVIDEADALDLLGALVDKSLLVPVPAPDDTEPRFRMLETIREYGQDRLADRRIGDEVRGRHLAYALQLARALEPTLRTRDQVAALATLDAERNNLVAALRYAVERTDRISAVRLVADIGWYYSLRGDHAEISDWARRALALDGDADPTSESLCLALRVVGLHDDPDRKESLAASAARLRELREADGFDRDHPLAALVQVGVDVFAEGFADTATPGRPQLGEAASASIAAAVGSGDPWLRSAVRFIELSWYDNAGVVSDDVTELLDAIGGFREVGDRWGQAMAASVLAVSCERRGRLDEARRWIDDAIALLVEVGAVDDVLQLRTRRLGLDLVAAGPEDTDRLRAELATIAADARHQGRPDAARYVGVAEVDLERRLGDTEAAERAAARLLEALGPSRMPGAPQVRAIALLSTALVLLRRDPAAARTQLAEAAAAARDVRDMPVVAMVGVGHAWLAERLGDDVLAARRLGAADAVRGGPDAANRDASDLEQRLRARMGDAAYDTAYGTGRALRRTAALALASPVPADGPGAGPDRTEVDEAGGAADPTDAQAFRR